MEGLTLFMGPKYYPKMKVIDELILPMTYFTSRSELDEVKTDVADEGFSDKYIEGRVEKEADKLKLIELEKELMNLKMQQSKTLTVDPKLTEAVKKQQSGTNIVDGSTDARSFNPSSTTVVQQNITDPIAMRQGLVNG